MNMYDIIYKKREGGTLDKDEIEFSSMDIQKGKSLIIRHLRF